MSATDLFEKKLYFLCSCEVLKLTVLWQLNVWPLDGPLRLKTFSLKTQNIQHQEAGICWGAWACNQLHETHWACKYNSESCSCLNEDHDQHARFSKVCG